MDKMTSEYVGKHRRPHDQLSPILKAYLARMREIELARRVAS